MKNMTTATEKPKSRARKTPSKKKANPASSLIAALKFISPAQKKAGQTSVQFCSISNKWVAASDGILTIACPIDEDLSACPNTLLFIEALSKATDELSITQLSLNTLVVSSGAFRALVPCVGFEEVPITAPDEKCAVIDDKIKDAFSSVAGILTEGSPIATYAAVLLQANSAVATNGAAILEYWHGIDLPPGMMIPKASALAILKAPKNLIGFGFSQSSATFYYEDGSFIKTQLFGERYPNYQNVITCENVNPVPVQAEFFDALRAIEAFSPNGHVFFENGAMLSAMRQEEASSYQVEGLTGEMGFAVKLLLSVEHAFKSVHFDVEDNKAFFFGDNVRGAVMGVELNKADTYQKVKEAPEKEERKHPFAIIEGEHYYDDDIPF